MTINTSKVPDRRKLRFDTLQNILEDAERLDPVNTKALGNWSGGQIFRHLARVMNSSIDGSPLRIPWFFRVLGRLMKNRILIKGMPPGYQLKGESAKFLVAAADTSWAQGLQELRQAVRRLQSESKREPSPFLGSMTREDWDKLHCRHAELHLSFLQPLGTGQPPA
jgi:hypothetical protein